MTSHLYEEFQSRLIRYVASFTLGLIDVVKPTVDTVLLCFIFILFDVYSAWDLSRRIKKKYDLKDSDVGKFVSKKALKSFNTVIKLIVVILGSNIIDRLILKEPIGLTSYIAAVFCFYMLWSVIENFSSENDSRWAQLVQKIMINKASRHLDVNLEEIKRSKEQVEKDLVNEIKEACDEK